MSNRKYFRSHGLHKLFIYAKPKKQLISFIRTNDNSYSEEELKLLTTGSLRNIVLVIQNTMQDENNIPEN